MSQHLHHPAIIYVIEEADDFSLHHIIGFAILYHFYDFPRCLMAASVRFEAKTLMIEIWFIGLFYHLCDYILHQFILVTRCSQWSHFTFCLLENIDSSCEIRTVAALFIFSKNSRCFPPSSARIPLLSFINATFLILIHSSMNCPKTLLIDIYSKILNFPSVAFTFAILYCIPSNSFTMFPTFLCPHDSDLLEAVKCHSFPIMIGNFYDSMGVSDFLLPIWISITFLWFDFHTPKGDNRISTVLHYISVINHAKFSDWKCFYFLAIAVIEELSATNISISTISDLIIISAPNHFTYVSVLLLPILHLNLTLSLRFQKLGTSSQLNLTRQEAPVIYNRLTKASKVSSTR